MKLAAFNATCPFEIGDKIKSRRRATPGEAEAFRLGPAAVVEEVHTITDIVCAGGPDAKQRRDADCGG